MFFFWENMGSKVYCFKLFLGGTKMYEVLTEKKLVWQLCPVALSVMASPSSGSFGGGVAVVSLFCFAFWLDVIEHGVKMCEVDQFHSAYHTSQLILLLISVILLFRVAILVNVQAAFPLQLARACLKRCAKRWWHCTFVTGRITRTIMQLLWTCCDYAAGKKMKDDSFETNIPRTHISTHKELIHWEGIWKRWKEIERDWKRKRRIPKILTYSHCKHCKHLRMRKGCCSFGKRAAGHIGTGRHLNMC